MKNLFYLALVALIVVGCNTTEKKETVVAESQAKELAYQSFGADFEAGKVLAQKEALEKYSALELGDTIPMTFQSEVNSVCQKKGCWMRMDMGGEEALVTFKDYTFFMPKDLAGQEVVVTGKAFLEERSVEDQRHFAEDAGKTKEEIESITETKKTYSFIATGVLVPEKP